MSLISGHTLLEYAAEHSADGAERDNQYGTAQYRWQRVPTVRQSIDYT